MKDRKSWQVKDGGSEFGRTQGGRPEVAGVLRSGVARGGVHGSKCGETGVVGEGGGVHGAAQAGKGLVGCVQTNVRRELARSADLQSSCPSGWRLTWSPPHVATGVGHLCMWRPDVQSSRPG